LSPRVIAKRLLIFLLIALNIAAYVSVSEGTSPTVGRARITFIDVGQGDAVFIELPGGKNLLVDGGPKSTEFDAGERIVTPFLKRKGISAIDLLLVSHPDADHLGGIPAVLRDFEVKEVLDNGLVARSDLYSEYRREVHRLGRMLHLGRAGKCQTMGDGVRMYILSPSSALLQSDTSTGEASMNNASVVLKLQHGDVSFLLAGDAAMEAEEEMLNTYGDFLKSTVLKIGHHGSRSSSSEKFLDAVRPEYAVFSVGKHNRFNHPSPDVIQRLSNLGVDMKRTDEEGAVVFESDGSSLSYVDWR
jgi:DNA internalization-related competence protein ComEC/Rec2